MKNKKLLWLLIGLVSVCVLLAACGSKVDPTEPSETVTEAPTETVPEETEAPQIEETEPTEPTEPVETTEPEETQPEETEPSGGATKPNVNTGTGGGYNPGGNTDPTEPTEPGEPTQPVIEVPAAGSENNAYYEQIKDGSGEFSTVKIPAGGTVHYRIQTAGSFLRIEDTDISIVFNGEDHTHQDGVIELVLPADDSAPIALQFSNRSAEAKQFKVAVQDAVGSQSNPILLDSMEEVAVSLEEGDMDGVYYLWTADKTGELKLGLTGEVPAGLNVSVNGKAAQLTEDADGKMSLSVKQDDEILIQVQAETDAEGNAPAAQLVLQGYIMQTVELKITQFPTEEETIVIPAGKSVYYKITGAKNKLLEVNAEDIRIAYNDSSVTPDEAGKLGLKLTDSPALIEIFNTGAEDRTYKLKFDYPVGHEKNPQVLTALGELPTVTQATENGYFYSYTVPSAGVVSFQMWTYPELENVKTDISLTNKTKGETVTLWTTDENGDPLENANISLNVAEGDELSIHVTAKNIAGRNVDAEFTVYGELYGSEEMPILVEYPGFEANVPAGKTLYYQGYNMSDLILSMEGESVQISHNGVNYTPVGGKITFSVVAEGRMPAVFGITNQSNKAAVYKVVFTYPVGHAENPDQLKLGTTTLTQQAASSDYYYTFTAPRAGTLTLKFDAAAQWMYAVDNITQGIYGDAQWSDSDPLVAETTLTVKARDEIRVRVNTYDAANMFETPAGTVIFEAEYVSGPTAVKNLATPTNTTLIPGECGLYTGQFYDHVLNISNAKDLIVIYGGTKYVAAANGEISVEFPAAGTGTQPDLEFKVQNIGSANITRSMLFSTKDVGSKENPDTLQYGPNVMTQTQNNGADYYYTFNVTANGRFTITFDADADWIYQLTNLTRNQTSGVQISSMGRNSYTITVRKGDVLELFVNTFDPSTGGSPVGTVEFTVVPA